MCTALLPELLPLVLCLYCPASYFVLLGFECLSYREQKEIFLLFFFAIMPVQQYNNKKKYH